MLKLQFYRDILISFTFFYGRLSMKSLSEHSAQNMSLVGHGMIVDQRMAFVYGKSTTYFNIID
jgi:hypothetical protein